jgi:hypothetical protein
VALSAYHSGLGLRARGRIADGLLVAEQSTESGANRRTFDRLPYRVPCEFSHDGHRMAGIVTDISARGLFIETSHRIPSGTELKLVLRDPRGSLELVGCVRREKRSHRSARQVLSGGFGLRLDVVPEAYFRLLVELGLG